MVTDGGDDMTEHLQMESKPAAVQSVLRGIGEEVKREIRRVHHDLGHPHRTVMLRLAKLAKKPPEYLYYIKHWDCPLCLQRAAPQRPRKASGVLRPQEFGMLVAIDMKEIKDASAEKHFLLNVLDVATRYSVLARLRDRAASTVARKFDKCWISFAGSPQRIVHDLGTEFGAAFTQALTRVGTMVEVIGLEGSWQAGLIARHGAVLGEILRAAVELAHVDGPEEIKLACTYAARCKNRRVDATGHSARTRVFGVQERWPHSIVDALQDGENVSDLSHLEGGQVQRTFEIRTASQQALLELDASARWRRALTGMPAPQTHDWLVGATVYYWRKARTQMAYRGRGTRLLERWHGPATIIGQDKRSSQPARNYWLAYGTHLLLVPGEHLRVATAEEVVANDVMRERIRDIQQTLGEENEQVTYWDLSLPEQTQGTIDVAEFRAVGRDPHLTPA
eukprot:6491786-Amphidinium_carterae.1